MTTIYKSETGATLVRQRYEELLKTWPVPAEHVRVPTREGETFVVVSGPPDAPPLLLLHGSGANSSMWRGDIASWATHFRTYVVDIIGEPGGSAPSRPPLDSDRLALWLDDVLEALGLESISVVATSLGGWVAVDYAIRRPGRITRLALLCPGGIGPQQFGWLPKALLLRLFGSRGVRHTARMVTGLDSPETEGALDDVVLTFNQFKPRTERLPVFPDEALRTLTMPMLLIVGDRDLMFDSAATAERISRCVPTATVRVLPGVGHAILGQTDTIERFLRAE
ncbi:pimeloyl-ACP methyl ester carboxylesterase [Nocardia tenerifensis]|uniref:Pimeloyl-ACP methyl ester carboxylesterase n=1 Tax=Nocardia tenerifensis TaxID=228006 RepID=A0A318K3M7_9NOCA|nr:alpha/beta hydrolase [Nocardia tenerifensis]PXX56610.1 pimeloyl-ACP methyl ester carboxylesterase [Nocardia tenerifensis]